ncbi:MAG: hypothetical protein H0V14_06130 [Chitinophagaceae bacterium]|nr:hypothetical protein [Chitinophagaceae bacterium]
MSFQLKISITKEIIEQCQNCGSKNEKYEIGKNCAVAFALIDIFPDAYVTNYYIYPFGIEHKKQPVLKIPLPIIAQQFINLFDAFPLTPNLRLLLPEFEFTIDVPDEVIEQINIDEVSELIEEDKKKYSFAKY